VAGTKVGDAYVEISSDDKKLTRGLADAKSRIVTWVDSVRGFMERIGQRLFDGLLIGLRRTVSAVGESIQAASDLGEAISKAGVVFGQSAGEVIAWSKTLDDAFGQSQQGALEAAGGFGNMFTAMGFSRKEAAEMSKTMVELASDLASFNNSDPEIGLEKIRAGLVGETEPLRVWGVVLNETVVAAKALEMGLAATKNEITDQDKVLARYQFILDNTTNSQGDFARTANDTANSQRRLSAQMKNLSATLGSALRPAYTSIINQLIEIGRQVEPYAEQIMANIARGLASAIRFILPALISLRNLFVYWLSPGSPPRLLPELIEWGRSAASQFVGGFARADFSALQTLGSSIESILRSFVGTKDIAETDIVSRMLGTREAITAAVTEFKRVGSVSQDTLNQIIRLGGPAGQSIGSMVEAYFRLRTASEATARAQEQLNDVTDRYDKILNPLRGKLDDVRDAQKKLRDQQRLVELQNTVNNFEATAAEKEAARLEIQQMALQNQIDLEEERRDTAIETAQTAVDTAKEQETAAQDQFDVAQAVLNQQVETNNLVAEEIRLQEQLAEARKQAAEAALREAEAAAKEQEQLAEDARREQEQLNDAILDYRMQLADTPGKIALMRGELAKTTEGSAEYYKILTQIASLEEQLANEREAAAKKAAGQREIELASAPAMELSSYTGEVNDISTAADDLKVAIDEVFTTLRTVTPEDNIRIREMGDSLTGLLKTFLEFARAVGIVKDSTNSDVDSMAKNTKLGYDSMASTMRVFTALLKGDFSTFWTELKLNWSMGFSQVNDDTNKWTGSIYQRFSAWTVEIRQIVGKWLSEQSVALAKWLTDLDVALTKWVDAAKRSIGNFFSGLGDSFRNAGKAATTGFFDGLKSGWVAIDTWFKDKLQAMKNLLPFSEPKDPSSPLRDLGKSGESMINMIHEGMQRAGDKLGSGLGNLAPAALNTAASTTNQVGGITINQVFNGAADAPAVRQAASTGILDALRAAGVTT